MTSMTSTTSLSPVAAGRMRGGQDGGAQRAVDDPGLPPHGTAADR
jgi:hypothetical protein